jgi:hypothetical protein
MISSLTRDTYPYVLEADRGNPTDQQSIFYIVPKSTRDVAVQAANVSKAIIDKRRGGQREINVDAMLNSDSHDWINAVRRVKNYLVLPNCPGPTEDTSGYDHFLLKSDTEPAAYAKQEDGAILVKDTKDPDDLKYIWWSISPTDQEEIMRAHADINVLKESLKNV